MEDKDSGVYCLIIRLPQAQGIQVGRLGYFNLPRGYYLYTGSAKRGLRARVRRHCRREKKPRWHVDYLIQCPLARVEGIICFPYQKDGECKINQEIKALEGAEVLAPGFGSSDCRLGCGSHLVYFQKKPNLTHLKELNLNSD